MVLTRRYCDRDLSVVGTRIGTDDVEIALIELHALATLGIALEAMSSLAETAAFASV